MLLPLRARSVSARPVEVSPQTLRQEHDSECRSRRLCSEDTGQHRISLGKKGHGQSANALPGSTNVTSPFCPSPGRVSYATWS